MEQNPPAVVYSVERGRYGRLTAYAFKQGRGGFWFDVPADDLVVHVGSLSLACKGGRDLFGSLIDSCNAFTPAEATDTAAQIAAQVAAGRPFATRLLAPYGALRPAAVAPALVPSPDPTAPAVPQALPAMTVGSATVGLAAAKTLHGAGPAVNLYNLLAVGGELSRLAAEQRRMREVQAGLQDCLGRLSAAVALLDVPQRLLAAWALLPGGVPRRGSATVPLLRLRETAEPGQWALELGVSLKIYPTPEAPEEGHLILVSGPAAARAVEAWCGERGGATLEAEVDAALGRIAIHAARLRSVSPVP